METTQNVTSTVPQNQTVENTDMNLLKRKRRILASIFMGIIIIIASIYLFFQEYKLFILHLTVIDIIIGIFFIRNEIRYSINTPIIYLLVKGISHSIKYGILLLILGLVLSGFSWFGYTLINYFFILFIMLAGSILIGNGISYNIKHSDYTLDILQVRKRKYGIALIITIMAPIIFSLFSLLNIVDNFILFRIFYSTSYYFIVIAPIFLISFLAYENKLAITTYMTYGNQISLTPGIKYGFIFFIFTLLLIGIKLILIFWFNQNLFSLFSFLYLVFLLLIIVIAYVINGIIVSKITIIKDNNPQMVFSEDGRKLGKYMLIFPIIGTGIIVFGVFFITSLAAGMGHGRFLFLGLNRKPRKANIKNSASWLINK